MEQDIKHSAVGELIRRHLDLSGETQTAFAKRAGISEGAVSGYVSGQENRGWFKDGHLEKIAKALGVSADDLAMARVEDLGYRVTEREFSPHETLMIGMLRDADTDAERDRVLKIIAAALGH